MNVVSAIPHLIRVWPDFGQQAGLSRVQSYEVASRMPPGIRIKLGNRLRLDAQKLSAWLAAGGNLGDRAS